MTPICSTGRTALERYLTADNDDDDGLSIPRFETRRYGPVYVLSSSREGGPHAPLAAKGRPAGAFLPPPPAGLTYAGFRRLRRLRDDSAGALLIGAKLLFGAAVFAICVAPFFILILTIGARP